MEDIAGRHVLRRAEARGRLRLPVGSCRARSCDLRPPPQPDGARAYPANFANLLDNDKPQWTSYSVLGVNALPSGNARMQLKSGFTQFDPRKLTLGSTFTF